MMPEISLNILDVTMNSVKAGASLVHISVKADTSADTLTVCIEDNGCGMTEEQVARVTDPFYTTRTTRKVGLGVPFFKMAALQSGGSFDIRSAPGEGTVVTAVFGLSNIDRMPLGDMAGTIHMIVTQNEETDFVYSHRIDDRGFELDTREMREILGGASFKEPEVSEYIKEYLRENIKESENGTVL